jgi:very-short-patch-repair endonuclease
MSITRARTLRRHMSPPEARLWNVLRAQQFRPYHFRRQVPFGPYYADFASHRARLVVEVDGSGHFTDDATAHDTRRTAFLHTQGYRMLRFTTADVLNHLDGVLTAILAVLPRID